MDQEFKYRAFISYSHSDEQWATWLHKALETYRVPKHVVGRETEFGPVPARFAPVFSSAIAMNSPRRRTSATH